MFLPRDKELDVLKQAWAEAKTGCPQVVTLLAESGFGKTRIAQEFYNHLSKTEDGPDGYWPVQITTDGDNLRVNPRIEECGLNDGAPPFLWWGMRIVDTGRRNGSVASTLSKGCEALMPHMINLNASMRKRRRNHKRGKAGGNLGVLAIETVVNGLEIAVEASAIGPVKTFFETGSALLEAHTDQTFDDVKVLPSDVVAKEQDQYEDKILNYLNLMCKTPPKGLEARPIVILIDDAHWSGDDLSLVTFVKNIMPRAQSEQWPILIIMTSWQKEWHQAQQADFDPDHPHHLAQLETMKTKPEWHTFEVPKLDGMAAMVELVFGGLSGGQVDEFCDRTDGNPLFMTELIKEFQSNKKYFINKDQNQALTVEGMAYVKSCSSLTDLVDKRLKNSPESIQKILALASVQGVVFSHSIVNQLANSLGIENGQADLAAAHSPNAFITEPNNDQCEFKTREYQNSAKKNLDNLDGIENWDTNLSAIILKLSNRGDPKTDAELEAIIAYCFDKETELHIDAAVNALQEAIDRTKQHYRIYDEELLLRKMIAILERGDWGDHSVTSLYYSRLAYNLNAQGRLNEADKWYRKTLDFKVDDVGGNLVDIARNYNNYGFSLNTQGRCSEAEPFIEHALKITKQYHGLNHEITAKCFNNLAYNFKGRRQIKKAEQLYRMVLFIRENVLPENHRDMADICNNLGVNLNSQGLFEDAMKLHKRSIKIKEQIFFEKDHPVLAQSYNALAFNYDSMKRHIKAESYYRRAYKINYKVLGAEHPETMMVLKNLSINLFFQGRIREALELQAKVKI